MPIKSFKLSVVIPVYNESDGLTSFHRDLVGVAKGCVEDNYEIIYCDDGSTDNTSDVIGPLCRDDPRVVLLRLSRNFGKESALSAGIGAASGDVVVMLDGDGQHPVKLIPQFVDAWRKGAQVVVGVRQPATDEGWLKRLSSRAFYIIFNQVANPKIVPRSTDFRLIDKQVQQAFLSLHENDRITRGLIDWLGFERHYISFQPLPRSHGKARYSYGKLIRLATNSFVSLTFRPLYVFGCLGGVITMFALSLGLAVGIEQIMLGDPLGWKFTGTALLAIVILFLVGIVLLSQGVLSLYVAYILSQSKGRPLYIIDRKRSIGLGHR
jgi:polyisoprenyl-phosphate glycosyltransferase